MIVVSSEVRSVACVVISGQWLLSFVSLIISSEATSTTSLLSVPCHMTSTSSTQHLVTIMPTLVVQHGKTSCYSPFSSKYPYRHHGTRIISVPQATPVNSKTLNLIKSPSPGLPPSDSTKNSLKSNKSCIEEEELPERLEIPVAVQLLVPASTDTSPLCDICQVSFDSDHSISSMFDES